MIFFREGINMMRNKIVCNIMFVLLVVCLVSAASQAQNSPGAYSVNVGDTLNARSAPSTDASVEYSLSNGDCLIASGETANADGFTWIQVVHPRDFTRLLWVADKFVKASPFCESALEEAGEFARIFSEWEIFYEGYCAGEQPYGMIIPPAVATTLHSGYMNRQVQKQDVYFCDYNGKETKTPLTTVSSDSLIGELLESISNAASSDNLDAFGVPDDFCSYGSEFAFYHIFTPEANEAQKNFSFSFFGGADCGQTIYFQKSGDSWKIYKYVRHCLYCG